MLTIEAYLLSQDSSKNFFPYLFTVGKNDLLFNIENASAVLSLRRGFLNRGATSNNSSYQEVVNCRASNYNSGAAFHASFTYLINITDISTHKVRFGTSTAGSNQVQLDGNSASNILDGTYFIFKKILDT